MDDRPSHNTFGLIGEKAAHLLLYSVWGEVGIPSTITTDQGAQFVNSWWRCRCSRLGVRLACSQAHHHQANGRAEVAGRVLQDILRKLLLENDINWVQALPRALKIHHDLVNPVTNLAPYEVVFGRERALAGLPLEDVHECPTADSFFEQMQEIDEKIARLMNDHLAKVAAGVNARRSEGTSYQNGDWVWYIRPKSVGGVKLQTWWQGPFRILSRVGARSYRLRTPQGDEFDAHQDQVKPCVWEQPGSLMARLHFPPLEDDCGFDDDATSSVASPLPSQERDGLPDAGVGAELSA